MFTSPVLMMQVGDRGQRVLMVGQTVHVPPELSGQTVTETDASHLVGMLGHEVWASGQMVVVSGQTVNVAAPSGQMV